MLLLPGDQKGQPPASIGCEAQRQPTTNCTCTRISHPGCQPEKTTSDVRSTAGKSFHYDGGHKSSFPSSVGLLRGAKWKVCPLFSVLQQYHRAHAV